MVETLWPAICGFTLRQVASVKRDLNPFRFPHGPLHSTPFLQSLLFSIGIVVNSFDAPAARARVMGAEPNAVEVKLVMTEDKQADRYLAAVREFGDNVLKYGRDTYGPKHTPLFVDGLNIHTHEPVKWIAPNGDRWILSNLASQQNLFRTLDGLTRITGDPKYKQAAMDAIKYAFENLRSPNGLLYWGISTAYDARGDDVFGMLADGYHLHCLKANIPYYELMWQVNPEATKRFIEAFWSAHILDWSNLDMNRYSIYNEKLERAWKHEYKSGPVFLESNSGGSLFNAGIDLIYAAASLTKLSGDKEPLIWAKRMAQRYVKTRHPKTGISYWMYKKSEWNIGDSSDDIMRKLVSGTSDFLVSDFPMFQFTNPKLRECCRGQFTPTPGISAQPFLFCWQPYFLLEEMLGYEGSEFKEWALEELTAYGKGSYRKEDNVYIPTLTDGTKLEGYVVKKDGPLGPKGVILEPFPAGSSDFWAYALAYRVTGNEFMWTIAQSIAKGNGFGNIGVTPKDRPQLQTGAACQNPYALSAFLELYRKTGRNEFLEIAQRIGDNILNSRFNKGFFVASNKHIYAKFDAIDSLALLHLHAALTGEVRVVPQLWPSLPYFSCYYRNKELAIDNAIIYTLTESTEPPLSLQEAAAAGNIELVRSLIEKGVDIDAIDDPFRKTALHQAVISGHKDVVEYLLTKGADVDATDSWPATPLHYAVNKGYREIVELLIAKGADVNARRGQPADDRPLHSAVRTGHKDIIELLITRGADINAKNNDGNTALDIALREGRKDIVELLIAKGAEVSIHTAVRLGDVERIRNLLERGVDVNARDMSGATPLHLATNKDVAELLLAKGADIKAKDQKGKSPLDVAMQEYRQEIVKLLVAKGAEASVYVAAFIGDVDKVIDFIGHGGSVDIADASGQTLLHWAAAGNHKDIAELLVSHSANVNAVAGKWKTPLGAAARTGGVEVAEYLIAHGANVNAGEGYWTPLQEAAYYSKEMVELLLAKGAHINAGKYTALHSALDAERFDIVELLLAKGANINARDEEGSTPLHLAASYAAEKKPSIVELLLSKGADINAKDNSGRTPLSCAKEEGHTEIVELLRKHGAKEDTPQSTSSQDKSSQGDKATKDTPSAPK